MHGHTYIRHPSSTDAVAAAAREFGLARVNLLGDVLAFGYNPNVDEIRKINDGTAESVRRHPELFTGFCYLNPENPAKSCRDEIERCVLELGFRGVKFEASINCRDRRLDPVMEKVRELGIPILHHSWYKSGGQEKNESSPADIAHLAARHPGVTIVMAHLGGARVRGVQDIKPFGNICVDTSGSQPMASLVEYAVAELGADRVVYGSDVAGRDYSAQIGRVLGSDLPDSQKRKILYGNARRILGLR